MPTIAPMPKPKMIIAGSNVIAARGAYRLS
jgi:hypothetical protein